jgi:hypothetical protein
LVELEPALYSPLVSIYTQVDEQGQRLLLTVNPPMLPDAECERSHLTTKHPPTVSDVLNIDAALPTLTPYADNFCLS